MSIPRLANNQAVEIRIRRIPAVGVQGPQGEDGDVGGVGPTGPAGPAGPDAGTVAYYTRAEVNRDDGPIVIPNDTEVEIDFEWNSDFPSIGSIIPGHTNDDLDANQADISRFAPSVAGLYQVEVFLEVGIDVVGVFFDNMALLTLYHGVDAIATQGVLSRSELYPFVVFHGFAQHIDTDEEFYVKVRASGDEDLQIFQGAITIVRIGDGPAGEQGPEGPVGEQGPRGEKGPDFTSTDGYETYEEVFSDIEVDEPDPPSTPYFADFIPTLTPLGYWRMSEPSGSTAADSSGNSHSFTVQTASGNAVLGAATILPYDGGATPGALDLYRPTNNSQGRAVISSASWMNVTNISVFAVMQANAVSGINTIASRDRTTGTTRNWWLYIDNGTLKVYIRGTGGGSGTYSISTASAVNAGEPYLIGFTYDGTNVKGYLGNITGPTNVETTVSAAQGDLNNAACDLVIGDYDHAGGITTNQKLDGRIDEFIIIGSAISTGDQADMYESFLLEP